MTLNVILALLLSFTSIDVRDPAIHGVMADLLRHGRFRRIAMTASPARPRFRFTSSRARASRGGKPVVVVAGDWSGL
jgi:hypothetical protein